MTWLDISRQSSMGVQSCRDLVRLKFGSTLGGTDPVRGEHEVLCSPETSRKDYRRRQHQHGSLNVVNRCQDPDLP